MQQQSLFAPTKGWEHLKLIDASVRIQHDFMSSEVAFGYYKAVRDITEWRRDKIVFMGRASLIPRFHEWLGSKPYRWSGITMPAKPMNYVVEQIHKAVEKATGASFNGVLLNYYRDGDDMVGWHADDEPELGPEPTIASLSLGTTRDFCMRHNGGKQKMTIPLAHGSLLEMSGETQKHWQHSLPKRRGAGPRINLTFRELKS
jgi:alkylated DNA repair dioxygenase AlkB